jgi:hypothetical protein
MEKEHCNSKDSMTKFTTGSLTTYPLKEWMFVVKREFDPDQMGHGRVAKDVHRLLEEHNSLVPAGGAKITLHEVIAAVLYTGPMVSGKISSGALCTIKVAADTT